jgi:hypothetical protein
MAYLWRAVDSEGEVLDVLVQSRRNKRAALKLMRKLLKKYALSQTSWSRRYKNRSASQGRMLRVFLELGNESVPASRSRSNFRSAPP